jgi:AcrR family transcriptional regulator
MPLHCTVGHRRRLLTWNKKMKLHSGFKANRKLSRAALRSPIIETASTIFQTKGLESTKVVDVGKRRGSSRVQFKQHFRSLANVLEALWSG